MQQPSLDLRGRRGTFSTSKDVCGSVAPGTPLRFLVVGATLAAPQLHFAWLAWRCPYEHRCLRKRGAWDAAAFSTQRNTTHTHTQLSAPQARFAPQAWYYQYEHRCLRKRGAWDAAAFSCGRRDFSTNMNVCGSVAPGTPLRFLVAGATLAAPQLRFAWPVWRFQYEHRCLRKRGAWDAAAFCGARRDTCCSNSASICVAGVALSVRA